MVARYTNIASMSAAEHYYIEDGAKHPKDDAKVEYYVAKHEEIRKTSLCFGHGAAALGLRGHVERGDFKKVLNGEVPGTDQVLGSIRNGRREHLPGGDLTLSATKSVSIEALVRGNVRALRAPNAAVKSTLRFVESDVLETRVWDAESRRMNRVPEPVNDFETLLTAI